MALSIHLCVTAGAPLSSTLQIAMNGRRPLSSKAIPEEARKQESTSTSVTVRRWWRDGDKMVVDVTRSEPALGKNGRVCGEGRAIPRCERE
jgi:hypothetical protein